jgi:hypothetical protein
MKFIFNIFLSIIFVMHSAWAEVMPQKIEFTIFDTEVKPIAGVKLNMMVNKADVQTGFLSIKIDESDV